MHTYGIKDCLDVVFAATSRIDSRSVSTYCMHTKANSSVDRLKAESSRDVPSIHGRCMANTICYFSKMTQVRTMHNNLGCV